MEDMEEDFYGPADINGGQDGGDDDVSLGSSSFDPYECSENDEDYEELQELQLILGRMRKEKNIRCPKFQHRRVDWDYHREMLIYTNEFENRFRMAPDHFDKLLEELREPLTVSVRHSLSSTKGNDHPRSNFSVWSPLLWDRGEPRVLG